MSEVLQANIFFMVTGIAVIVLTFLLVIALYHTIRILKGIRRIMDRIEAESENIAEDMRNIRAYFAEEGLVTRIFQKLFGTRSGTKGSGKSNGSTPAPQKKAERGGRTELPIKDEE